MNRTSWKRLGAIAGLLALSACGLKAEIGINRPAPGQEPALDWPDVPGASAYQVTVYVDRAGLSPVARSGFTAASALPLEALQWLPDTALDRPYFWVVRAFDRPSPDGLLLNAFGPYEQLFPLP